MKKAFVENLNLPAACVKEQTAYRRERTLRRKTWYQSITDWTVIKGKSLSIRNVFV